MTLAALNEHVDAAISDVYRDLLRGVISESEAEHRAAVLTAQRPVTRPISRSLRATLPVSKFALRRCQRSPDREANRTRRRQWSGDGRMPPGVRAHFTEGERAALTIIALEVKRQGYCDLHVGAIANKAGVCRSTTQNAIREAYRLRLISKEERRVPGRKSHTNILRIISPPWLEWLKKGPGIAVGHKTLATFNLVNPNKRKIFKTETASPVERQRGIRKEYG